MTIKGLQDNLGSRSFLVRLIELLAESVDTIPILERGCWLIAEHLHVSRVIFRQFDSVGTPIAAAVQCAMGARRLSDPDEVNAFDPRSLTMPEGDEPQWSDDVREQSGLTRFQKAAYESADIRSWMVATVSGSGRDRVRLIVHHHSIRSWSEGDLQSLSLMARALYLRTLHRRSGSRIRPRDAARVPQQIKDDGDWRRIVHAAGIGTWTWDLRTNRVAWSDGLPDSHAASQGDGEVSYDEWLNRVHPGDRALFEDALIRARQHQRHFAVEFRSVRSDGAISWHAARGQFDYSAGGVPLRAAGVISNITSRRRSEEQQQVLLREAQHRTRNVLGLVAVLINRCLEENSNLEGFRATMQARLDALSRVQSLLRTEQSSARVPLYDLIRGELEALGPQAAEIQLHGPREVGLEASAAQVFALALHELTTNSVKHGALRQGKLLRISWEFSGNPSDPEVLQITWHESGLQLATNAAEQSSGFGRQLIEEALPYQFGAQTRYRLDGDGVECVIILRAQSHEDETLPTGKARSP